MRTSYILLVSLLALIGCTLFSKPSDPVEVLPPATQEGKNTFGCLVNGEIWIPKGYNGTSNLDLSYDPSYLQGTLNLYTYRLDESIFQSITLFSDSIKAIGVYPLNNPSRQSIFFDDLKTGCAYPNDPDVTHTGSITITRFDQHVISGTFEVTLTKSDCPTITITMGRFDMRI